MEAASDRDTETAPGVFLIATESPLDPNEKARLDTIISEARAPSAPALTVQPK